MEHWNGYLTRGNIENVAENIRSILEGRAFATAYTDGVTGGEGRQPILDACISLVSVEVEQNDTHSSLTITDTQNSVMIWTSFEEGDDIDSEDPPPLLHCHKDRIAILHIGHANRRYHRVYELAPAI